MIDIERAKRLVHSPDSPTLIEELERRIDNLNRIRVRKMDYLIARIKESQSLSKDTYGIFKRELENLKRFK